MNKDKKILVCDDDEGILEVINIILSENGYTVKILSNGKSIQKHISNFSPDLIFLDIWMPGIDGKEIIKILKRNPQTQNIPILVISALNDIEKIANDTQADGYLSKPFDMSDLLSAVERYSK